MGMLETGTAHLTSQLKQHTSVSVSYSRSDAFGSSSMPVQATRGSSPFEASDTEGIIHRTSQRDYLIAVADFPFEMPPKDGDTITDIDGTGAEVVFLVASMTGERPWRYADPGETLLRIHTKRH